MSESNGGPPKFGIRKNVKLVGRTDITDGRTGCRGERLCLKVWLNGDIMLVNLERYRSKEKQPSGLKIYDLSNKEKPQEIGFYQTNGGVHRFTFDAATPTSRRTSKSTSAAFR